MTGRRVLPGPSAPRDHAALGLCAYPPRARSPAPRQRRRRTGRDQGGSQETTRRSSPAPILNEPIYECTDTVFVHGYIRRWNVEVFVAGTVRAIGHGSAFPSMSRSRQACTSRREGAYRDTDLQRRDRQAVERRDRTRGQDVSNGLPSPGSSRRSSGAARRRARTGSCPAPPGVHLEPALSGGGFNPSDDRADGRFGAGQWMIVNPAFGLGDRVHASTRSAPLRAAVGSEIVQQQPPTIPPPTVDQGYEGQEIIVVRSIVNGAVLDVFTPTIRRIGSGAARRQAEAGSRCRCRPRPSPETTSCDQALRPTRARQGPHGQAVQRSSGGEDQAAVARRRAGRGRRVGSRRGDPDLRERGEGRGRRRLADQPRPAAQGWRDRGRRPDPREMQEQPDLGGPGEVPPEQ